MNRFSSMI